MYLSVIVAVSKNNLIGINNKLPWYIPEDLKWFSNFTTNYKKSHRNIIMGRKTFKSIGRALPNRKNIVISNTLKPNNSTKNICITKSLEEALNEAQVDLNKPIPKNIYDISTDYIEQFLVKQEQTFMIGGADNFNKMINKSHFIYFTRIHQDFTGDTYINNWENKNTHNKIYERKSKYNDLEYSFEIWVKKIS